MITHVFVVQMISKSNEDYGSWIHQGVMLFQTKQRAVQGMLSYLVEHNFVDLKAGAESKHLSEKEMMTRVKTEEDLHSICLEYGGPSYRESWKFRIYMEEVL